MLNTVISYSIAFLKKHHVAIESTDEHEIYYYAFQVLYSYLLDLLIILFTAALTRRFYTTAAIVMIFAFLQVSGGGYHASKKINCTLLMAALCIIGNLCVHALQQMPLLMITASAAAYIVLFTLAPITHVDHPVSRKVYERSSKQKNRIASVLSTTFIFFIITGKYTAAATITTLLCLYLISFISAKIKKKINGGKNGIY